MSGGCNPQLSNDAPEVGPTHCTGGAIEVTWTITDLCETKTVKATWTLTGDTPPSWPTTPQPLVIPCDAEDKVGLITTWLAANGNGIAEDNCNGTLTYSTSPTTAQAVYDALQAPGAGSSTTVSFTVSDGCGNAATETATVSIEDTAPPTCPILANVNLNAEEGVCTNGTDVSVPEATDNCSGETITAVGTRSDNAPINNPWTVGITTINWTFTDAAQNSVTCTQQVVVTDNQPPVLIGEIPSGEANMNLCFDDRPAGPTIEEIKDLFSDNCGVINVVKEADIDPDANDCEWSVTYTYTVTDASNNAAPSSVQITYSGGDKTAPELDGTLPIGAQNMNLCLSGAPAGPTALEIMALYTDNCGVVNVVKSGSPTGTNCAWSVTYNYTIEDNCKNEADPVQITYSGSDQTAPSLTGTAYSQSGTINNCKPTQAAAEDMFDDAKALAGYTDNCSGALTVTRTATVVTGDDCQWTVEHTYTVKDACQNELTGQKYEEDGEDKTAPSLTGTAYSQVGKINSCKPDQAAAEALFDNAKAGAGYTDNCSGALTVTRTATVVTGDNCNWAVEHTYTLKDACQNELAGLTYKEDGWDKTAPTGTLPAAITGVVGNKPTQSEAEAAFDPTYALSAGYSDACGGTVTATLSSAVVTGTDCNWMVTYYFGVKDACDNVRSDQTYTRSGQAAPVVITSVPASTTLSGNCHTAQFVDSEFNNWLAGTPFQFTGGAPPVNVSITYVVTDFAGATSTSTVAVAPPNDGGSTTVIWTVSDNCGNSVITSRQFSVNTCFRVSGDIRYYRGLSGVADRTVTMTAPGISGLSSSPNGAYTVYSTTTGTYTVRPIPDTLGISSVLTAAQLEAEGITSADVARLNLHIGTGTLFPTNNLEGLVQRIAGNVVLGSAGSTTNNRLNSNDVGAITQAINGSQTQQRRLIRRYIPANASFVTALPDTMGTSRTYGFVPVANAAASPAGYGTYVQTREYNPLSGPLTNQHFIAVRVGDVDVPGPVSIGNANSEVRYEGTPLVWKVKDAVLREGEVIEAVFRAEQMTNLLAWQFGLQFDTDYLRVENLSTTNALPLDPEVNFGLYRADEGIIRGLWAEGVKKSLKKGEPVFSVRFKVLRGGVNLSDILQLDGTMVSDFAMPDWNNKVGVLLSFDGIRPNRQTPVLYQNAPNPFDKDTRVRFELPVASDLQLTIHDINGRLIKELNGYYDAGMHEVLFTRSDLGQYTGVLYYTLRCGAFTATRRMVVME